MGKEKTLYEILQVAPEASLEVIKGAYRALLKNAGQHPDLGGKSEAAQAINEAYAILSNPETRKEYNNTLAMGSAGATEAPRPYLLLVCPSCRHRNLLEDARELRRARCFKCGKPLEGRPRTQEQDDARAYRLGLFLFDRRMYDRARYEFQAAVRIKPREGKYHYWLGRTHYQTRSLQNARAAFATASKLNMKQFHYLFWLAQTSYRLRDFATAAEGFQVATDLRPGHIPTLLRLGMCFYRLKEFKSAVKVLKKATSRRTPRFQPLFWLGLSHMALREFSQAAEVLEKALKQQPANTQAQNYLAVCRRQLD